MMRLENGDMLHLVVRTSTPTDRQQADSYCGNPTGNA
jgi:hypothetical protein